ncbi:MAG: efflux RND transporter permease subunit [Planctomycetota bacterium]
MLISNIAIRRPIFTAMVISALMVFGAVSLFRLGVDLFPKVDFPVITIVTALPGADPETMEMRVTDPIEEAVNTLSSIKTLRSTSAEGYSLLIVEFQLEKNVDVAFQEIQARLNAIRPQLPLDIEEPVIEKFDMDSAPILTVVVSADMGPRELTILADKTVKERLQRIRNVGSARLVGGRDRKIWLWLDPERLRQHHLTVQHVRTALQTQHVEMPGGRVETGALELVTRTRAEFSSATELNDLLLTPDVRLRDVGAAEDGLEEDRSAAELDGKPCIALQIRRQSGTNTVQVARDVKAEVEKLRAELAPRGIRLEIATDMSAFIQLAVSNVEHHLVLGGLMAVLTVLVFLLNFRSTLISAMVLPTSILATFMMLLVMGFTLNMMTLMALTLAIGLLIDDAIVVQENIMRHVQEGKSAPQAAAFATNEIGLAVLATTLSVVAVFLPVAFTRGIVGRFFWPFGLTIAFAVLISMFVSFTLDPMMSSRLLKKHDRMNPFFRMLENAFGAIERRYESALGWALRRRWLVVGIGGAALIGVIALTPFLRQEFTPIEDRSEFNIVVSAPQGSPLSRTRAVMGEIRGRLAVFPEVKYTLGIIGADEMKKVNEGSLYVRLIPKNTRKRSQQELMREARLAIADVADVKTSVQQVGDVSGGGFKWAEVQCEIRGRDQAVLVDLSNRMIAALDRKITVPDGGKRRPAELLRREGAEAVVRLDGAERRVPAADVRPTFVDLHSSYETGKPEADILILRDRAAALGVSPLDVADTVRAAVGGADIGKFKSGGDRYDIAVRLFESARNTPEKILELAVPSRNGNLVELRNVAEVARTDIPVEITRFNRQRNVTTLANLQEGTALGTAIAEVEALTHPSKDGRPAEVPLPPGYTIGWAGQAEFMGESFGYLFETMILSVVVVFMVLAAQFDSLVHPFTIMLSLPLAFVGALGALIAFGSPVSIFVMISFIFLLGLVTKNAILLIDYTNTLRERDGLSMKDALLKAGPVRLRPILMTSMAMIFGMLPSALGTGEGAESNRPMAVSIIGGLVSSTLLTLLVVPAIYSILDPISERMKDFIGRAKV